MLPVATLWEQKLCWKFYLETRCKLVCIFFNMARITESGALINRKISWNVTGRTGCAMLSDGSTILSVWSFDGTTILSCSLYIVVWMTIVEVCFLIETAFQKKVTILIKDTIYLSYFDWFYKWDRDGALTAISEPLSQTSVISWNRGVKKWIVIQPLMRKKVMKVLQKIPGTSNWSISLFYLKRRFFYLF